MKTKIESSKAVSSSIPSQIAPAVTPSTAAPQGTPAAAPKGFQLQAVQMLQGVQTVIPQGSALTTLGGTLSQATMASQLQQMVQVYQAVDDKAVELTQARQQLEASLPTFRQEYQAMKTAITGFLPVGSPLLAKFGLTVPAKRQALTGEQAVVRQAKANATRKLRGTLGKRQKQAVKFTGPLQVSVAAPADPAATEAAAEPSSTPGSPPGAKTS